MLLLDELEQTDRFPEGWTPFTVRINKRPIGKGASVTVIIGYRPTSAKVPRLSHGEAGVIYEQIQDDIAATRVRPDPAEESPAA
jgi:hypothetical protein